jgi:hypothetical protein
MGTSGGRRMQKGRGNSWIEGDSATMAPVLAGRPVAVRTLSISVGIGCWSSGTATSVSSDAVALDVGGDAVAGAVAPLDRPLRAPNDRGRTATLSRTLRTGGSPQLSAVLMPSVGTGAGDSSHPHGGLPPCLLDGASARDVQDRGKSNAGEFEVGAAMFPNVGLRIPGAPRPDATRRWR